MGVGSSGALSATACCRRITHQCIRSTARRHDLQNNTNVAGGPGKSGPLAKVWKWLCEVAAEKESSPTAEQRFDIEKPVLFIIHNYYDDYYYYYQVLLHDCTSTVVLDYSYSTLQYHNEYQYKLTRIKLIYIYI